MPERVKSVIIDITYSTQATVEVRERFLQRAEAGRFSKDENPESHYCIFFASVDPATQRVFVGRHIKSGLWLVNGGHIDEGETPPEALTREIGEEWGDDYGVKIDFENIQSELLTIIPIDNPTKQPCTEHLDIWYFVYCNETQFNPDQEKLAAEFTETGWYPVNNIPQPTSQPMQEAMEYLLHKL